MKHVEEAEVTERTVKHEERRSGDEQRASGLRPTEAADDLGFLR